MKYLVFSALFLVLTSLSAKASEIELSARAYNPLHCGYYWNVLADFTVDYHNQDLPWGTQVILHHAFHELGPGEEYWSQPADDVMSSVAPYSWRADLNSIVIDEREGFKLNTIEFVVEIIFPDGRHVFDNGGRDAFGHYGAVLNMGTQCDPGSFEPLTVQRYSALDPAEKGPGL